MYLGASVAWLVKLPGGYVFVIIFELGVGGARLGLSAEIIIPVYLSFIRLVGGKLTLSTIPNRRQAGF